MPVIYPPKAKKQKLNLLTKYSTLAVVVAMIGGGIAATHRLMKEQPYTESTEDNTANIEHISGSADNPSSSSGTATLAPPLSLDTITEAAFISPVSLILDNDGAIYVFDAGDKSIHRFSNQEPTYAVGRYSYPGFRPSTADEYTQRFKDSTPFTIGSVDNFDGTVSIFQPPQMTFVRRVEGTLLHERVSIVHGSPISGERLKHYERCRDLEWVTDSFKRVLRRDGSYPSVERCAHAHDTYWPWDFARGQSLESFQGNSFVVEAAKDCGLDSETIEAANLYSFYGPVTYGSNACSDLLNTATGFVGTLRHYVTDRVKEEGFIPPTYYTPLNDTPTRIPAKFSMIFTDENYLTGHQKGNGRCNLLPLIAFNDTEQVIMTGYMCDDGEFEPNTRIPYASSGISSPEIPALIPQFYFNGRLYLMNNKANKVKVIEIP